MRNFVQQLQLRIDQEVLPIIGEKPPRIVLLDAPDHPNVGDQAILLGELAFLRRHFPQSKLHVASYTTYHAGLDELIRDADLTFLHGGGNFGDIWPQHHEFRLYVLETFRDRRLIQFPQSIFFSDTAALERTQRAIAACADFHLLARDERAFNFAREKLACPTTMCPDMAFSLGPLTPARPAMDVFCLFRTDKEVLEPKARAVARLLADAGLSHQIEDWLDEPARAKYFHGILRRLAKRRVATSAVSSYGQYAFEMYARARLKRGIRLLSRGEVVMTDRLHGFILSTLLGRRRFVWDSFDGKISAFHDTWLPDDEGVRFLHSVDELRAVVSSDLGKGRGRPVRRQAQTSGIIA
jgi:exopolysaccharide biosynthesis predicted pyruvyltransferase EpsI